MGKTPSWPFYEWKQVDLFAPSWSAYFSLAINEPQTEKMDGKRRDARRHEGWSGVNARVSLFPTFLARPTEAVDGNRGHFKIYFMYFCWLRGDRRRPEKKRVVGRGTRGLKADMEWAESEVGSFHTGGRKVSSNNGDLHQGWYICGYTYQIHLRVLNTRKELGFIYINKD